MMEILKELSPEDLNIIILKFQENYSYEELSAYLNISVDEVKQKEYNILLRLKNDDSIKSMIKEKIN